MLERWLWKVCSLAEEDSTGFQWQPSFIEKKVKTSTETFQTPRRASNCQNIAKYTALICSQHSELFVFHSGIMLAGIVTNSWHKQLIVLAPNTPSYVIRYLEHAEHMNGQKHFDNLVSLKLGCCWNPLSVLWIAAILCKYFFSMRYYWHCFDEWLEFFLTT